MFSSHLLAEVASICDRVVVVDRGRVVLDPPVRADHTRLRVVVDGVGAGTLRAALFRSPGCGPWRRGSVWWTDPALAPEITAAVTRQGWRLRELGPAPDDLEVAFLDAVTGGHT